MPRLENILSPHTSVGANGRRVSDRSDIAVESEANYRSLENGEASVEVSRPNSPVVRIRSAHSMISTASGVETTGSTVGAIMQDMDARVVYLNDPSKNTGFCDNKVVTAKYTKLNFIPRFFYGRLSQVTRMRRSLLFVIF